VLRFFCCFGGHKCLEKTHSLKPLSHTLFDSTWKSLCSMLKQHVSPPAHKEVPPKKQKQSTHTHTHTHTRTQQSLLSISHTSTRTSHGYMHVFSELTECSSCCHTDGWWLSALFGTGGLHYEPETSPVKKRQMNKCVRKRERLHSLPPEKNNQLLSC